MRILCLVVIVLFCKLYCVSCAQDAPRAMSLIGGTSIENNNLFPWLVSLQGKVITKRFLFIPLAHTHYYCGGSVISDRWILTAAHCFYLHPKAIRPSVWEVRLASTKLKKSPLDWFKDIIAKIINKDEWRQFEIDVEKIITHPKYDKNNRWINDIALVKLKGRAPVGPQFASIDKVSLPRYNIQDWPQAKQECVMTGWGCETTGRPVSKKAKKLNIPIVSNNSCRRFWSVGTDKRMCAGFHLEKKGLCAGDSGGPLVCKKDGRWVQAGIASFSDRYRPGDVPGVFTRVSAYVDWIEEVMRKH